VDIEMIDREREGFTVLKVRGEVDLGQGAVLKKELLRHINEAGAVVVIDLTAVSFIDSTGLSALVVAHREARRLNVHLRLVADNPTVLNVFTLTGLGDLFRIFPTLDAATGTVLPISV
jgi:anti-sigma B factor antagonist